jgi:hypothetical protein
MAEEVLQAIIKQAETLAPEEKLRLARSLELMIPTFFPAGVIAESLGKMQVYKGEILGFAAQYGASNLRVLPEIKNNELEFIFIVDLESGRSLFDQSGLMVALRELLNFNVWVFTENGLKERVRDRILAEAYPL